MQAACPLDSGQQWVGGVHIVDKNDLQTNHILVACQNVEGCGHGLLGFDALIEALFNLRVSVVEGLKTGLGVGGGYHVGLDLRG